MYLGKINELVSCPCYNITLYQDGTHALWHLYIHTRSKLRVCPWEDQAEVAHAISPIWKKLGQFKGVTSKLLHQVSRNLNKTGGGVGYPPCFQDQNQEKSLENSTKCRRPSCTQDLIDNPNIFYQQYLVPNELHIRSSVLCIKLPVNQGLSINLHLAFLFTR